LLGPRITAALIVRDEEHHLPACLASLAGIAEEIVIVDTGSSDRSVQIAESAGARVLHYAWTDDFAEARNVALDHARGAWILYLDADERVHTSDPGAVVRRLEHAPEAALRILLRPFTDSTPFFEYRLWRSDPEIRFRGVIHEQVVDDIHRVAARDGRPIGNWEGLAIDHVGYDGDQAAKHRRNLPLLRRQLETDPFNIFNWRHLARILVALGDEEEAERSLERAVALARNERSPSSHASQAWADLVRLRHSRGGATEDLLSEGLARWPENWQLVWVQGNVLLESSRYQEAAACFQCLLEVDLANLPAGGVSYDQRLFGAFAQSSLGVALFRMGRNTEAAEAFAAAARLEPRAREHEARQALAAQRARA
jgi:glycosyltransferase involved in cell wall biosynthesis